MKLSLVQCRAGMLLARPGDVVFRLSSPGRSSGFLFLLRDVAVVRSWGPTSLWGKEIQSGHVMGAKFSTCHGWGVSGRQGSSACVKLLCQTGELTQLQCWGCHSSLSSRGTLGSDLPVSLRLLRELSHGQGLGEKKGLQCDGTLIEPSW